MSANRTGGRFHRVQVFADATSLALDSSDSDESESSEEDGYHRPNVHFPKQETRAVLPRSIIGFAADLVNLLRTSPDFGGDPDDFAQNALRAVVDHQIKYPITELAAHVLGMILPFEKGAATILLRCLTTSPHVTSVALVGIIDKCLLLAPTFQEMILSTVLDSVVTSDLRNILDVSSVLLGLDAPEGHHWKLLQGIVDHPIIGALYPVLSTSLFLPCFRRMCSSTPHVARKFYGDLLFYAAQGEAGVEPLQVSLLQASKVALPKSKGGVSVTDVVTPEMFRMAALLAEKSQVIFTVDFCVEYVTQHSDKSLRTVADVVALLTATELIDLIQKLTGQLQRHTMSRNCWLLSFLILILPASLRCDAIEKAALVAAFEGFMRHWLVATLPLPKPITNMSVSQRMLYRQGVMPREGFDCCGGACPIHNPKNTDVPDGPCALFAKALELIPGSRIEQENFSHLVRFVLLSETDMQIAPFLRTRMNDLRQLAPVLARFYSLLEAALVKGHVETIHILLACGFEIKYAPSRVSWLRESQRAAILWLSLVYQKSGEVWNTLREYASNGEKDFINASAPGCFLAYFQTPAMENLPVFDENHQLVKLSNGKSQVSSELMKHLALYPPSDDGSIGHNATAADIVKYFDALFHPETKLILPERNKDMVATGRLFNPDTEWRLDTVKHQREFFPFNQFFLDHYLVNPTTAPDVMIVAECGSVMVHSFVLAQSKTFNNLVTSVKTESGDPTRLHLGSLLRAEDKPILQAFVLQLYLPDEFLFHSVDVATGCLRIAEFLQMDQDRYFDQILQSANDPLALNRLIETALTLRLGTHLSKQASDKLSSLLSAGQQSDTPLVPFECPHVVLSETVHWWRVCRCGKEKTHHTVFMPKVTPKPRSRLVSQTFSGESAGKKVKVELKDE